MASAAAAPDIETGLAHQLGAGLALGGADDRSVVSMSNYVAGVLLFLFLAGLLPLSLLVLASVLLVCLATCIRAYVVHQFEQRLNSPQGMSRLAEALQLVSAAHPLLARGSQLDLANLRLSLVQRDFGSGDYESLLQLDSGLAPCRRVSERRIRELPTYAHRRTCGCKQGEEHLCCVCLEAYSEGSAVTQLPCAHAFHADCIQPWLRQQGLAATCPLCKAHVWPQK